MQKKFYLLFFIFLFLLSDLIVAQSEEKIILNTVQHFFDALGTRDTTKAKNVLLTDCQFFSIRENESNININKTTHTGFIKKLVSSNDPIQEIMRDPVVLINKHVAVVWTNYKFYKNGEYSHSGVDAFSLLKTSEGWKIAGLIYNIE